MAVEALFVAMSALMTAQVAVGPAAVAAQPDTIVITGSKLTGAIYIASLDARLLQAPSSSEVQIQEPDRATNTWRSFGGRCGGHQYQITISPGKPLSTGITGAQVDRVSAEKSVEKMMKASPVSSGILIDVAIDRCERKRARIGLQAVDPVRPKDLQFYYFWLTSNGAAQWEGKK